MADNLKERGPRDRARINVNEAWEVDWWCKKWNVSPETLKAAVAKVGVMSKDVARQLRKPSPL